MDFPISNFLIVSALPPNCLFPSLLTCNYCSKVVCPIIYEKKNRRFPDKYDEYINILKLAHPYIIEKNSNDWYVFCNQICESKYINHQMLL